MSVMAPLKKVKTPVFKTFDKKIKGNYRRSCPGAEQLQLLCAAGNSSFR